MTPAGTSNELDVQNGWEENTHTVLSSDKILFFKSKSVVLLVKIESSVREDKPEKRKRKIGNQRSHTNSSKAYRVSGTEVQAYFKS